MVIALNDTVEAKIHAARNGEAHHMACDCGCGGKGASCGKAKTPKGKPKAPKSPPKPKGKRDGKPGR